MAAASARPLVSIQTLESDMATKGPAATSSLPLPNVMKSSIRPDIISFVHREMSSNSRQSYAVSKRAGHQTPAESWGTGRAVSRIPRVPGGGTHRAGQGAFGNMCRGGRMFAPTKIWRKWHSKINRKQRRFALTSAIAASSVPSLVMARGHCIDSVPEIPLVISDSAESVEKTSNAIKGAYPDVEKVRDNAQIRPGKGKMRNRRHLSGKGPLIVYGTEGAKLVKAFRNIPGVDVVNVRRLNLLKLAPGGHLGRFIIWTKSAFERLDSVYGSFGKPSKMMNADLARVINSDEIQSVLRATEKEVKKKNPLKNLNTMLRLNPFGKTSRRMALMAEAEHVKIKKIKKAKLDKKRYYADLYGNDYNKWFVEFDHVLAQRRDFQMSDLEPHFRSFSLRRLMYEHKMWHITFPCVAGPVGEDYYHWTAHFASAPETPYGERITVEFNISTDYPFVSPRVTFVTKICHPNVGIDGSVHLPILEHWTAVSRLSSVIDEIYALLKEMEVVKEAEAEKEKEAME